MPRTVGKAGASVRKMQTRFRNTRLGMLIALLAAVLGLIWLSFHHLKHPGWWSAGIVMTLVIVLQMLEKRADRAERRLRKSARQAKQGAEGEEQVEEILARLSDDHAVIHDLLGDYGNIDHVVVAPHGVFAIETKSHWGQLTSDGSTLLLDGRSLPKDVVGQTLRSALWLRDRIKERTGLEVYVHAVLVFTRARASVPLPKLKGVQIVEARRLLEVIGQSHGRPIPAGQIASAITADPVVRH